MSDNTLLKLDIIFLWIIGYFFQINVIDSHTHTHTQPNLTLSLVIINFFRFNYIKGECSYVTYISD